MNKLIKFLRKHKVLTEFNKHFKSYHDGSLESFCGRVSPENYISNAFPWSHSKKGMDLWIRLDKEWRKSL